MPIVFNIVSYYIVICIYNGKKIIFFTNRKIKRVNAPTKTQKEKNENADNNDEEDEDEDEDDNDDV